MQERQFIEKALGEAEGRFQSAMRAMSRAGPRPPPDILDEVRRTREARDALMARLMQIEDRTREEAEATTAQHQLDLRRAEREEAAFWFRRFFTTLGIANGAAFAALAGGLLQADDPVKLAPIVAQAMDTFAWGAIAAGTIPFVLWIEIFFRFEASGLASEIRDERIARLPELIAASLVPLLTTASVYLFCMGAFTATGAVHGLAEGKKVADARVEAQAKAAHHAAPLAVTGLKATP